MKKIDWTDQIFSNCKIISPLNIGYTTGHDHWKILCKCGKEFIAMPSNLKNHSTKSCGCEKNSLISLSKRQNSYYNYINNFNVKLIEPINILKDKSNNSWIAECPYDKEKFITTPHSVISNNVKSCGCLNKKQRLVNLDIYNKQYRINKGYNENDKLTNISSAIRSITFDKVKALILELDSYTCNLCLKRGGCLEVHHVQPWRNSDDYFLLYDIKNLITLCRSCHINLAHDGQSRKLNLEIQKELNIIISMRYIDRFILDKYSEIVEKDITISIKNYLDGVL